MHLCIHFYIMHYILYIIKNTDLYDAHGLPDVLAAPGEEGEGLALHSRPTSPTNPAYISLLPAMYVIQYIDYRITFV